MQYFDLGTASYVNSLTFYLQIWHLSYLVGVMNKKKERKKNRNVSSGRTECPSVNKADPF